MSRRAFITGFVDTLARPGGNITGFALFEYSISGNGFSSRMTRIEARWSAGDADRSRRYAAELFALAADVLVASGGSVVGSLLQVTRTVPIVLLSLSADDPQGQARLKAFVLGLQQLGWTQGRNLPADEVIE